MPETIRSGLPCSTCAIATLTQSVGVPSTAKTSGPHRFEPQRPAQRQRMADRARFLDRGDDGHLAERRQRIGERVYPLGMHAVVIGDENSRHLEPTILPAWDGAVRSEHQQHGRDARPARRRLPNATGAPNRSYRQAKRDARGQRAHTERRVVHAKRRTLPVGRREVGDERLFRAFGQREVTRRRRGTTR